MFKGSRTKETEVRDILTLGDFLSRRRKELGHSLSDVAQQLGIRREYLEALEEGSYEMLPPRVYVHGFIKKYATFLGLNGEQLVKIYHREITFLDKNFHKEKITLPAAGTKFLPRLIVTPRLVTVLVSLAVLAILGFYLWHQISSFNSKPYLVMQNPLSDTVVREREFHLTGQAEKGADLKLNDQRIKMDAEGNFDEMVNLKEGKNVFVIEVKNRFNKLTTREFNIIYEKAGSAEEVREIVPPLTPSAGEAAQTMPVPVDSTLRSADFNR